VTQSELPALIRSLLDPSVYPHPAPNVELVQTHISYVLLAGDYAYKIKKPVDFGFLDYSTLAKRRYYCRQEVLLNSQLCSDTYLGVVAIRSQDGSFSFRERGRVVEYAVRMRRLPEERMMNRLLERGEVDRAMVRAVAERLVAFHATAKTSPRMATAGDRAIRYAWRENFDQWSPHIGGTITARQDRILRCFGEAFFARNRPLLERRVAQLRIRECHSDLRSDAVCFTDGVCIFDCVEFSRRIRLVDVARDVGFLAMDLDYRGHAELADTFVEDYIRLSGDEDLREVIDFYKCYNACVRAKVEGLLVGESEVPVSKRSAAGKAARRYFALACSYAERLPPAMLVLTCGLSGTGKSTVARTVADRKGFTVISSDLVRKESAGLAPEEHRYETFGKGLYAADITEHTYSELFRRARPLLLEGRSVILDASFIRRSHRKEAARLARETGAQFACLALEAPPETVRGRLRRRTASGAGPSDARWEVYVAQKRRFQRPREVPAARIKPVDATLSASRNATVVRRWLAELSPLSFEKRGSIESETA
jgi:aminoglycoside phosphotransferase family enzyme/predicted kinase